MEIYEQLEQLINKKSKYSAKEREFIAGLCAEHDIQLNTLCAECYRDAAVVLYGMLKPKAESDAKYVLRTGIDVWWNGIRVNKDTIDDAKAAEWLEQGLPRILFEHIAE